MALLLMFLSSSAEAFGNLCFRRSIDVGGSSRGYLVVQVFCSFCIALLISRFHGDAASFSLKGGALGVIGGLFLGSMLIALGKALERGPAGLTLAAVNATSVLPSVVMVMIFGKAFGHRYEIWHGLGAGLVVFGLFWAGWGKVGQRLWLLFTLGACIFYLMLLTFLEWRLLLIKGPFDLSGLVSFRLEEQAIASFTPALVFTAFLIQLVHYLRYQRRWPNFKEMKFGILGGSFNGAATYLLVIAPEWGSPLQNAMLYPFFAVTMIMGCNLWAQRLYKEKIRWAGNFVALAGLIIGTFDWTILAP